ncbi:energy transducer TonB [Pseudomonas sp.]|uniref:energy transducer TonB family protein n=1 Tax=Pseudomonas sp. TaxID=306 RepID=UPI002589AD27|nr:energy transducer TonB [Pseudomonas sp.]
MYAFYRARQWLGGLPALAALVIIVIGVRTEPLKIEPTYDESAVELALVEPEPEKPVEPVVETPPPPPVVEEEEAVLPPPPKPVPKPVPPKPVPPKPTPKPVVKGTPVAKPQPAPAATTAPAPVVAQAKPAPAPAPPKVDSQALEGGYLQGLRGEIDRFKQYPTSRQAALERPTGEVVVWLLVDRAGNVLDSGIQTQASSMLLNRAASTSLRRIKQVKPFPEQAFGGRSQQRFTATFNYSVQ